MIFCYILFLMRHVLTAALILLLALFMSPGKAQAHGLEQHQASSVSSGHDTSGQSAQAVSVQKDGGTAIDTAPSHTAKKNCSGSCCGTCICGMSGLPATAAFGLAPQRAAQTLTPYHQPLRQGPPYPLLRPPRLSA